MSEAATAPAAAPAPAPAPDAGAAAPSAAPAAPAAGAPAAAPAPAAPESLIHGEPAAAPPASPDGKADTPPAGTPDPLADLLAKLPEKFQVKAGDKLDAAASLAKALEHRDHLEKRLHAGDVPPKSEAEYAFQPPEEFKDFTFKEDRLNAFKKEALAAGITGKQYEFMMNSYLKAVPDLMEGAAAMSAAEARAELGKVWTTPDQLQAGLADAQRALRGLPADLQEATREFGTNPAFLRAMAHMGAQMREDRPPASTSAPTAPAADVQTLMKHPAYTDPKHPEHAAVSAKVRQFYAQAHGTQPL